MHTYIHMHTCIHTPSPYKPVTLLWRLRCVWQGSGRGRLGPVWGPGSLKPDTARTVDFSGRGRLGPVWGPGSLKPDTARTVDFSGRGRLGPVWVPGIVSGARHRAHGGLQWEGPTGACLGPGYWSLTPDTARTVDFSGRGRLGPVWVPVSVSEARHRAHGGLQWEGPTGACLGPGCRSLKPDTARTVDFSGRGRLGPVWVPGVGL